MARDFVFVTLNRVGTRRKRIEKNRRVRFKKKKKRNFSVPVEIKMFKKFAGITDEFLYEQKKRALLLRCREYVIARHIRAYTQTSNYEIVKRRMGYVDRPGMRSTGVLDFRIIGFGADTRKRRKMSRHLTTYLCNRRNDGV